MPKSYISQSGIVLRTISDDIFVIAKDEHQADRILGISGMGRYKSLTKLTPKTKHLSVHLAFLGAIGLIDRQGWVAVYSILH